MAEPVTRQQLDAALGGLVGDGVLRADQAEAVRARLAGTGPAADSVGRGTIAAAYVGVGLIAAAVATVLVQSWDDLRVAERSAVFAALTVALVLAGVWLERVRTARAMSWLIAVVTSAGLAAAVTSGHGVGDDTRWMVGSVTMLAVAVPLLVASRTAAQVVGFFLAITVATVAAVELLDLGPVGAGAVTWTAGVALAAAAGAGWVPAPPLAQPLGGGMALVGVHLAFGDAPVLGGLLAVLLALAGYAAAVRDDAAMPLTVATATVAVTGPRLLGRWLDDSLGAAGVLAVSGVVVLAAAALHLRVVRRR